MKHFNAIESGDNVHFSNSTKLEISSFRRLKREQYVNETEMMMQLTIFIQTCRKRKGGAD